MLLPSFAPESLEPHPEPERENQWNPGYSSCWKALTWSSHAGCLLPIPQILQTRHHLTGSCFILITPCSIGTATVMYLYTLWTPYMVGSPTRRSYGPLLDYKLLEGRGSDSLTHPCIPQHCVAHSKGSLNVLELWLKYNRFLSSDKWAKFQ